MKSFFVVLFTCCVTIVLMQNVSPSGISFKQESELQLIQAFLPDIFTGIKSFLRENETETPDPFPIPYSSIAFEDRPIALFDLILSLNLSLCEAILSGHSSIFTEYTLGPQWPNPKASFRILTDLPIIFSGFHDLYINATVGGVENIISSAGEFDVELQGPYIVINMVVNIDLQADRFTLTELTLDLGFDCIAINMDALTHNGEEVDLGAISAQLQPQFDTYWSSIRSTIEPILEFIINILTRDCSLLEIQTLDFSCLTAVSRSEVYGGAREEILNLFELKNNQTCSEPIETFLPSKLRSTATCVQQTPETTTTVHPSSATSIKFTTILLILFHVFLR